MIRAATLPATALVLGSAFLSAPALATTLDENGLRGEIIGRVLKGSMGPFTVRVLHRADGTSSIESPRGNDEGRWQIRQGQLCVQWTTLRGGQENCGTLEPLGGGQYRTSGRGLVLQIEN